MMKEIVLNREVSTFWHASPLQNGIKRAIKDYIFGKTNKPVSNSIKLAIPGRINRFLISKKAEVRIFDFFFFTSFGPCKKHPLLYPIGTFSKHQLQEPGLLIRIPGLTYSLLYTVTHRDLINIEKSRNEI